MFGQMIKNLKGEDFFVLGNDPVSIEIRFSLLVLDSSAGIAQGVWQVRPQISCRLSKGPVFSEFH